jgi:glycosyltransferase involved in cell wall biosynthesis
MYQDATIDHPQTGSPKPDISVVVPVYNHWNLVPILLDCLNSQSLDQQRFEVLLVDNGSDWIPRDLALPSWVRLLHCATPGSYAARNEAIRNARGRLLAFTDADCQPSPEWLTNGTGCFESISETNKIVAGGVAVVPQDWNNMTACEIYDVALGLPQARYVRHGVAVTANLFVPAKIFERVGLFNQKHFSGGDTELVRRAVRQGVALQYCAEAAISHPARRLWPQLRDKRLRTLGAKIHADDPKRRAKHIFRTILPPGRGWRIALFSKQPSLRHRVLICSVQTRLWFAELVEMFRLFGGKPPRRS